jgi:transposase-like protein
MTHCICPYCKQETGIGTAALFDTVLMSRKTCEKCGREFLIVNDMPMTQEQYDRRVNDSGV